MTPALSHAAENKPSVTVEGLRVSTPNGRRIVEDISFEIAAGEILGVVGESGSGKTTLGLALLHYCRRGLDISSGVVRIGGEILPPPGRENEQHVRSRLACYVPQDPATALNPALRIRTQLEECFIRGGIPSGITLHDLLEEVMLPTRPEFLDAFPHQLSGGQLQRVAIAMAFANRPRLIVMDEPTTGLDVTTQAHVLKTVRRLSEHYKVAVVYVSHDIAVVASIARRTAVVYAGRIVEIGPTGRVLGAPSHPYTRALIRAVPDLGSDFAVSGITGQAPDTGADLGRCAFAPRCELSIDTCRRAVPDLSAIDPDHQVRCFRAEFREHHALRPLPAHEAIRPEAPLLSVRDLTAFHGQAKILHGLTFEIGKGECVGVVGTSGSGKTTLARSLAGLHGEIGGEMFYRQGPLAAGSHRRDPEARRNIQYIFQNPYGSLNPRRSVGASIAMARSQFSRESTADLRRKVLRVLDQVSLPSSAAERYPGQLSGGQRQRVAIARALIAEPDMLICDEITSALDVSVQARIMELLADLQRERGLTILFVSHNLAVVRNIAQRIVVMQQGRIAENGRTDDILGNPQSEVTKRLLQDAPRFLQPAHSSIEIMHAI